MHRIILLLLIIFLAACQTTTAPEGILTGHVSIGPLQPAVQVGMPEPTPNAQVYATRQIVIFDERGRKEIARAPINAQGMYEIALPAGTYSVDINHSGIDFAKGFPALVEINPYEVTRLDVSIDTGIR
jgi:hypothetical protein